MCKISLEEYIKDQIKEYEKAITVFFRRFGDDSKNLTHEAFTRAYISLKMSQKPIPLDDFRAYIYKICRNISKDIWKKRSKKNTFHLENDDYLCIPDQNQSSFEILYQEELRTMIKSEFAQILSPKLWKVVILWTYESEKFSYIGERLNISENTARQRFFEARKQLKEFLERRRSRDTRGV